MKLYFAHISARHVDKMLNSDNILSSLSEKLSPGVNPNAGIGGLSGLQDRDYPLASQNGEYQEQIHTGYLFIEKLSWS